MDILTESDPEKLALLYVQQWLHEQGYSSALGALERESGIIYDDTKLRLSAKLMQLVWSDMEAILASDVNEAAAGRRAEDEALLRGGNSDYPTKVAACIEGVHPSSVTCIRAYPACDMAVTGSGDGHVRLVEFSGNVLWETRIGSGGVLCLDLLEQKKNISDGTESTILIAAGSMDGSLSVIEASTGEVMASIKAHSKYLIRVIWAPSLPNDRQDRSSCGEAVHLITASQDQSLGIFQWQPALGNDQGRLLAQHEGGCHDEPTLPKYSLEALKHIPFLAPLQDVLLLRDGVTIVVALKGTNYLRLLDLRRIHDVDPGDVLINMNEAGDDHVSFSARHLALSPDGRYLLVSTDSARVLMMRTTDWTLSRSFFATSEQFHNPVAAWHHDGFYIYVATVLAEVWVFHVGSCKVVAKLAAHKINVRDLSYDDLSNRLLTCSFDKTVKVFRLDSSEH